MATAAERSRRHRDRQKRCVVAVVPVEITQEDIDTIIEGCGVTADDCSPELLPGCAQMGFDEWIKALRGED